MIAPFVQWLHASESFPLKSDEVHVWSVLLDSEALQTHQLFTILAKNEQIRADKFRFEKDRIRFITVRGLLRRILSLYLRLKPEQLSFCYGSFGKPALAEASGGRTLRFNVSHAGEQALCIVSNKREVGIDVEQVRSDFNFLSIAERFFTRREADVLSALPVEMQARAFFNCWTRKEAYIKAQGQGLSLPLDQFEVSFVPGEPARLLSTAHNVEYITRWYLQEIPLSSTYVAAIAVEGNGWRVKYLQL